jgi:membrane protein
VASTDTIPHPRALPESIPGTLIDPPQKRRGELVRTLDGKVVVAGVAYRAFHRFTRARATVLAAGTTYYVFLALFAVVVFAYGLAATLGADRIADTVTEYLGEAFPGLIGEDGINPEQLQAAGQTTSIVGMVILLYSGSGAVAAMASSMHMLYGAPQDPRNYAWNRLRYLLWLLLIAPLIVLSYVPSTFITAFLDPFIERLGLEGTGVRTVIVVLSLLVTYVLNYLIVVLLLRNFGGIKPNRRALAIGAAAGALVLEVLKYAANLVIQNSLDNPAYGTFAIPIAVLLTLYLQTITLYGSASLTAAVARQSVGVVPGEPLTAEQFAAGADRGRKDQDAAPGR